MKGEYRLLLQNCAGQQAGVLSVSDESRPSMEVSASGRRYDGDTCARRMQGHLWTGPYVSGIEPETP